uniref:Inositol3 putative n=1 Tax=Albugo laibachii Nc14 TaxID=890382 RepID=F0WVR4_9STRA|nr:inositol3 putative [Albugo laibachii Nc14]|eukprot:CCA25510.1 inositol3 putative [Albugo laibachii Nc14]
MLVNQSVAPDKQLACLSITQRSMEKNQSTEEPSSNQIHRISMEEKAASISTSPNANTAAHAELRDEENASKLSSMRRYLSSTPRDTHVKPRLEVTNSGKLQDQFYHATPASSAIGFIKHRWYTTKKHKGKDSATPTGSSVFDEQGGNVSSWPCNENTAVNGSKKRGVLHHPATFSDSTASVTKGEEYFSEADIVHAGYLVKQGSFWKSWRRRYFILRRDVPILAYYTSKENLTKLGEICIDDQSILKRTPRNGIPHCFTVKHGTRSLIMFTEDGEDSMKIWMDRIGRYIRLRTGENAISNAIMDREQITANSTDSTLIPDTAVIRSKLSLSTSHLVPKHQSLKLSSSDSSRLLGALEQINIRSPSIQSNDVNSMHRGRKARSYSASGAIMSSRYGVRHFRRETIMSCDDSQIRLREEAGEDTEYMDNRHTRSLSLTQFRPAPSIELFVSIGCRDISEIAQMLVASFIVISGNKELVELSRTEIQSNFVTRKLRGGFDVREFMTTLSVPLKLRQMIHFEIYSATNPNSEALSNQESLGFARVSPIELLFSSDRTIMLECRRSPTASQARLLILNRLTPTDTTDLGHSYIYAKRHFIAQKSWYDKRSSSEMPNGMLFRNFTGDYVGGELEKAISTNDLSIPASTGSINLHDAHLSGRLTRTSMDATETEHVLISEELSASFCSVSIAFAYVKMLQTRNMRRTHDAGRFVADIGRKYDNTPSSPCSKTQSEDTINLHSELIRDARDRLTHYTQLHEMYVSREEYYHSLLRMLEEGKEPGITGCLKRSVYKKDKLGEFMPVNLNCHLFRVKEVSFDAAAAGYLSTFPHSGRCRRMDELIFPVITHGCSAAHSLGFKEGGLRRLQHLYTQSASDQRLLERMEHRQDIVFSQALAITAAAFLTIIGLAFQHSGEHIEHLKFISSAGFLVNTESLLSTLGSEKGMLEDMAEASLWLTRSVSLQIVQSMEEGRLIPCTKCVGVTSSESGDQVVATFAVPSEVFAILPEKLQQGQLIKVYSVLFTQGINEMQSVANTVLDTRLQDEINHESGKTLAQYFESFKVQFLRLYGDEDKLQSDIAEYLVHLKAEVRSFLDRLRMALTHHVQRKNVNLLIESSDLCRKLGAARTTCCKSVPRQTWNPTLQRYA